MKFAFALVVVAGVGIGLLLPGNKQPAPVAVVAVPADARQTTVLTREDNGHFYTAADVNNEPIRFVVDTGATTVALTIADARRAHISVDPSRFEPVGMGAGGVVNGQRVHVNELVLEGKRATDFSALVLDGLTVSLLGQSYLKTLDQVEIRGDTMTLK